MNYFKLLRIDHWIKNFFVFAPLFFSGQLTDEKKLVICIIGFLAFCFTASSIYILNDIVDINDDSLHPVKKKRPVTSGKISKTNALITLILLLVTGLSIAYFLNIFFLLILSVYFILNAFYSLWLKKISIVDILIISFGFLLRVAAGGILTDIEVSHWLYIMTFFLSLFLALAKRRDDVFLLQQTGIEMRTSVKGYNLEFISIAISILSAVLIVSYLYYITSEEVMERFQNNYLYISVIFVVTGILRYLQITHVEKESGSPTEILIKDRFLQIILALWIIFFVFIIYLF